MTDEELMAWSDKNICRGKGLASRGDGAGAMGVGMQKAALGSFCAAFIRP